MDVAGGADQEGATIQAFGNLGMRVIVSELDIDVLPPAVAQGSADMNVHVAAETNLNPYANELPDRVQQLLKKRYGELFVVFLRHRDVVQRVTFWGVTDGDSWKNDWPVRGRTNYPLLFDRNGQPKPAFGAVKLTIPVFG